MLKRVFRVGRLTPTSQSSRKSLSTNLDLLSGKPRYLRLPSTASSSETKGEFLCRRFAFICFIHVQFVSFAESLPSLRPGAWGTTVFVVLFPRVPPCKLIACLHSTRVSRSIGARRACSFRAHVMSLHASSLCDRCLLSDAVLLSADRLSAYVHVSLVYEHCADWWFCLL